MTNEDDESAIVQKAYNSFGNEYVETYPDDLSLFKPIVDRFIAKLPQGGRVVDIGCGNGAYVRYLLDLGFDALGTDQSRTMLDHALNMVPAERLLELDMHHMQCFDDNSFDGVLSITSFLYTSKKRFPGLLKDVHRILKPNGHLLLMMLEGEGEGLEVETFGGKEGKTYSAYYGVEELHRLLEESGFVIEGTDVTRLVVLTYSEITILASSGIR